MGKISYGLHDKIFSFLNYAFLGLCFIVVFYPLLYVLSSSFSSTHAVISGRVWLLPVEPTLKGYHAVFQNRQIWSGYYNSLYYMVVGTAINVLMTLLAAYPLARKTFAGRNTIMFLFVFTMFFSGGMIPSYLLVRSLGMINTRWAMLIPGAISVWNVIITRTYLATTIPNELLEASQIDGCSDVRFFYSVVLPLSGPIIAVISLFYAGAHWNAFFSALLYLRDAKLYPLQIVLRDILIRSEMASMLDIEMTESLDGMRDLLKYSLIVVASVPVLMMYPFAQKYFVRGIMIGAIKG